MISTVIRKAYLLSASFLILSLLSAFAFKNSVVYGADEPERANVLLSGNLNSGSGGLRFAQDEFLSSEFIKARGAPYSGIIHVHSSVSQEGFYPLRKLVVLAQSKGIKILVLTDTFLNRWEYGLPIFPNIFKASVEKRCIAGYGIKNYLRDLEAIRREFPDMAILAGAEVAPFYWYSGSIFKGNLSLNDWSRHLLVIGLNNYQDYARLPVAGNRYCKPRLKDILSLFIPVVLIIFGLFLLKKNSSGKILGWVLSAAGVLFLFNAFPFSASRFDAYHGQKGFLPYQELINYVNKRNGLVFWAHPLVAQESSSRKIFKINFYTPPYPEALVETRGYAGFGASMPADSGDNPVLAEGEWDEALKDYCQSLRKQPVWVIGEAEYAGEGDIDSAQNIFFLPELSLRSVEEALRKGRFYVRAHAKNNANVSLSDFHIEDSFGEGSSGFKAFMGDTIQVSGSARIFIKGGFADNFSGNLKIEVIGDGKVVREFEFTGGHDFALEFQDDFSRDPGKMSYFRLLFFADNRIISMTNPIFVVKNG